MVPSRPSPTPSCVAPAICAYCDNNISKRLRRRPDCESVVYQRREWRGWWSIRGGLRWRFSRRVHINMTFFRLNQTTYQDKKARSISEMFMDVNRTVYMCSVSFLRSLFFFIIFIIPLHRRDSFSPLFVSSLVFFLFAFIFSHQSYTNPRRWGLPANNLLDYQNQNLFYSAKILASQSPRGAVVVVVVPRPFAEPPPPFWWIIARSCRTRPTPILY